MRKFFGSYLIAKKIFTTSYVSCEAAGGIHAVEVCHTRDVFGDGVHSLVQLLVFLENHPHCAEIEPSMEEDLLAMVLGNLT